MRDFASLQTNPWMRQRAAEGCLALALSPAFAWMGPFDVTEQEFLARVGYWAGEFACWFLTLAVVERLFDTRGIAPALPPPLRWLAAVGVAALPMMVVVAPATHVLTGWMPYPAKIVSLYFKIVVLGAGVSMIARAAFGLRFETSRSPRAAAPQGAAARSPAAEEAAILPATSNALVMRLPPALRGRLIALEMEDHYARIHTDRGSGLVLLRLSDAIAECAPTPGRQVHRSWWVADAAIDRLERTGRVGRLRLPNGLSAPVSQRYRREVELFLSGRADAPASEPPDFTPCG